jgi:hypothetical protein
MKKFFSNTYKKINTFLLFVSLVTFVLIYLFISLGYCVELCSYEMKVAVINPIYSGVKWLSLILLILMTIPSHIFRRWLFYVAPLPIVLTILLVQNISIYSSGIMQASRGKMAENGMFVLGVITIIFVVTHLIYDRKKVISK